MSISRSQRLLVFYNVQCPVSTVQGCFKVQLTLQRGVVARNLATVMPLVPCSRLGMSLLTRHLRTEQCYPGYSTISVRQIFTPLAQASRAMRAENPGKNNIYVAHMLHIWSAK